MTVSIEKRLRHPDVQVRRSAVLSLLQSDRSDKREVLEEFLLIETNTRLQFLVRRSLNSLQKQSVTEKKHHLADQIRKDLSSNNIKKQQNAARSIAQYNLHDFLPDLISLGDRSCVFSLAALHLMRKDSVKYFDRVRSFLKDQHPNVVMKALEVLIEYGHTSALTLSLQYLNHSEPKISSFVKRKLIRLGSEQLNILFDELISKNQLKYDRLIFHSILKIRFSNTFEILNTIKYRAKGEFLKQIEHIIEKLKIHQPKQSQSTSHNKELSPLELKFRQTQSADELIFLIRSLDQVRAKRDLKLRLLMRFLSHPEPEVRLASLETLVPLAPDNLVILFQQFLHDKFPAIRATAILALGQNPQFKPIYKDEILISLKEMIKLGDKDSLMNAITCIGNLVDENLIPLVQEILEHPNVDLEIQDAGYEILKSFNRELPSTTNSCNRLPGEELLESHDQYELSIDGPTFLLKLEEALLGEDKKNKIALLKGLAQFEVTPYAESVTQLLYRLHQFEEDPKVLALMLRNLGLYQFRDSSDFLLEYLQHPHIDVKAAALRSLAYYNDSRLLVSFTELLNESWKSNKPLKLIDEIIEYVFVKRPDLGLIALEKLGKLGRSQEKRLEQWLNYCQCSSWPTLEIINSWFELEFSENFLDFLCALICQLLTNWNLDDVAPLLLKNPHQKYRKRFEEAIKLLRPSLDLSTYISHPSTCKVSVKSVETMDKRKQAIASNQRKEKDSLESLGDSNSIIEPSTIEVQNRHSSSNSYLKNIPHVITIITGSIASFSLYLLLISLPKDLTSTPLNLNPSFDLPKNETDFSAKATFLGQKSINLAMFNWNGHSLVAKLTSPQWLTFDINEFVTVNGNFKGRDQIGNLVLDVNSFTK